jgi:hypothetical protein
MPCLPPPAPPNWRLVMGDGTGHADVIFDSAPAAVDHMALPGNLTLQALDQQDDGFRRFRLRL